MQINMQILMKITYIYHAEDFLHNHRKLNHCTYSNHNINRIKHKKL